LLITNIILRKGTFYFFSFFLAQPPLPPHFRSSPTFFNQHQPKLSRDPTVASSSHPFLSTHVKSRSSTEVHPSSSRGGAFHGSEPSSSFSRPTSYDRPSFHSHDHLPRVAHAPPHRNIDPTSSHRYDTRVSRHSTEEQTPVARYRPSDSAPFHSYDQPSNFSIPRGPWSISTDFHPTRRPEEDEQTPVARYHEPPPSSPTILHQTHHTVREDNPGGSATSKYECSYCGKGFNRPSSLKVKSRMLYV
jgi:hypothetical protein